MMLAPGSEPYVLALIIAFYVGIVIWAIFAIWMLVDCLQYEPGANNSKLIWILIILFGMGVGPLIYFFGRRRERKSELGK